MEPAVVSIAMIIVYIPRSLTNSIDVPLEHANMVIDPRIIDTWGRGYKFRFSVNGRTLTITRIDEDGGWNHGDVHLRAYLPTEDIPDFTSTVYLYHGLYDEQAPEDTTKVNFAPSVTTIQMNAFRGCRSLVRITIPDTITVIDDDAFRDCDSLRYIRLPINLELISIAAFANCKSLEAVFLPSTVTSINNAAFGYCTSLRFCILTDTIDLGHGVFRGCTNRLPTAVRNNLSTVCSSTSVTPQSIQECMDTHGIECATEVDDQQMMALHILCANPHVTGDCIRTYLGLAPEAAEQQDCDGMTPFQRLCRNDITFFDDRSFCSVMAWWYHCMP